MNRYLDMGTTFQYKAELGAESLQKGFQGINVRDYLLFLSDYGLNSLESCAYDDYNEILDCFGRKMKQEAVVTQMRSSKHLGIYTK